MTCDCRCAFIFQWLASVVASACINGCSGDVRDVKQFLGADKQQQQQQQQQYHQSSFLEPS
jgi:hypothetical protein